MLPPPLELLPLTFAAEASLELVEEGVVVLVDTEEVALVAASVLRFAP
jgi:hypothetical protein